MNDVNQNSPYSAPQADLGGTDTQSRRYAGFWIRVLATIIDSIVILIITGPLLYGIYGVDAFMSEDLVQGTAHVLISYVFPFIFTIVLWMKYGGTPGKRMLGLRVINEASGEHLNLSQSIIRYVGYLISLIVLLIGVIWVAFNTKKKGWHDYMAGSVVIVD